MTATSHLRMVISRSISRCLSVTCLALAVYGGLAMSVSNARGAESSPASSFTVADGQGQSVDGRGLRLGWLKEGVAASVSINGSPSGLDGSWSTDMDVGKNGFLPTAGHLYRLTAISETIAHRGPHGGPVVERLGGVTFAPAEAGHASTAATDPDAMVLTAASALEITGAGKKTTLILEAPETAASLPAAAVVSWFDYDWPPGSASSRAEAKNTVRLTRGSEIRTAQGILTVQAIETESGDHPMWVVLKARRSR